MTAGGSVHGFGGAIDVGSAPGPTVAAVAAMHHGDLARTRLAAPVVGIAPKPTGRGYWLAWADGGVFASGDPRYLGGAAVRVAHPVVGIAAVPGGGGYWLLGSDGAVLAFGGARFHGSSPLPG